MSVTRVIWVDTKKNRFHWHTRLIKRCKLKQFSLNKDTKNHAERCSSPTPSGLLWDGDSRRSNPWPSPRMFLQREALQARGNHALQYGGGLWENHFMYRIWSSSRRFQGLLYAYVFFFLYSHKIILNLISLWINPCLCKFMKLNLYQQCDST